ncbi:2-hydroxycarboxylate transporter family protein [Gulosibacter faecalis]|uniref:2-hydroxycarboxylate transporter family protein n=1 Tax=Gulosibacter faecalis TaxID=272240 RepID=A0ABW5UU25_9MICO|nr:2-hydroxycarboxylate transporter family protein [Gulosibacter faecalis]
MSKTSSIRYGTNTGPETQAILTRERPNWFQRSNLNRIGDMPISYFLVIAALITFAGVIGILPSSMLVGFAVTLAFGGLLMWIGNWVPVIRDYGLPTILCTFVPAILMFAGVLPVNISDVASTFLDGQGFLDFFVVAVIAGTVLGMPRALLVKAGPRFAIPLVGCLAVTFLVIGAVGALTGYGFIDGILFVAAPVMAGGLGLGAVPMSEMYAQHTGQESGFFMGDLISAVVVANIFCILFAGLLNGIGKARKQWFIGFNGEGELLRTKGTHAELKMPKKKTASTFNSLGKGLLIAGALFVLGTVLNYYLPFLHAYAWTVLAAAAVKLFGLLPEELEEASSEWGDLLTTYFVPALLVAVSMTYIDIAEVLQSLTNPAFLLLVLLCVIVAGLSSGIIGWLVRFNFIEIAITPGLVMADTGGSGDVSVLSASERMHLMPFAAITNRIGGTLVLFVTSLLVPLLAI